MYIFTEDKYIEFYFTLDDRITIKIVFLSKYQKRCLLLNVGDIVTSAIMHLSGTVDPKLQFTSTDFNSYNKVATAKIFGAEKCDKVCFSISYGVGRARVFLGYYPGPCWLNL